MGKGVRARAAQSSLPGPGLVVAKPPTKRNRKGNGRDNNGPGRPSKRTPDTIKKLEENIGKGLPYELACRLSGISGTAYRNWIMAASQPGADPELVGFLLRMTRAETKAEATLVEKWLNKTDDDWRAARDYLSRRWPERWAESHRHSGPGGGPIPIQGAFIVVKGTPQEYMDALRQARTALTDGQEHGDRDSSQFGH